MAREVGNRIGDLMHRDAGNDPGEGFLQEPHSEPVGDRRIAKAKPARKVDRVKAKKKRKKDEDAPMKVESKGRRDYYN